MTDFEKIKAYYNVFNEWGRLGNPEGRLEFELSILIITSHLPQKAEILDLGGGPGRYTIELAKLGHSLHLADLSQTLLDEARKRIDELEIENVKSITQINAVDLSFYGDNSFDAVLLFGPLYHLTNETERFSCVKEVNRVLKPNGLVFASFIPYLTGAIGVVGRMFYFPDQVSVETLKRVFEQGIFNNLADRGFQEGYYPTSDELASLFNENGFSKILLRSIRGWGSNREEQIFKLKTDDPEKYEVVIELINQTADDPSIIEMCSHAIYIGQKNR
ncbi:MAG: class I SAM-dependent methyltransferase [Oscillospiraceae bacterium]|nr:class I SAM-dependent methyltransferase [Oscillospiraceae bacterium]